MFDFFLNRSLDDYWYYSVMTLGMLMIFEGMLCKQRQNSLLMLRSMRRPPVQLWVYRGGWIETLSLFLVPGDIISIGSKASKPQNLKYASISDNNSSDDSTLPCDALVIRGSCVVNEAMLTGDEASMLFHLYNLYQSD